MDFSKVKSWTINGKEVKTLEVGGQIYWKKKEAPPVECKAFYIEDCSGLENSLSLTKQHETDSPNIQLEYSTDGQQWQTWADCQTTPLPIAPNSKVFLRGTNNSFGIGLVAGNTFNCTQNYNVGGDLTTLLDPNGGVLDLSEKYCCFLGLFYQSTTLINAKDLVLTSDILTDKVYGIMFSGCVNMISAPKLLAKTLFQQCYGSMFNGCEKISEIEVGATNWVENSSIAWLQGVAPTGNFIMPTELQIGWVDGQIPINEDGIPQGWTVNGEVPIVPTNYFYVEDISGAENDVYFTRWSSTPKPNLEYSTDGSAWTTWSDPYNTHISIQPNSRVYLRGTNNIFYNIFLQTKTKFNVGGDITTLLVPNGNVLDLTGRLNTFKGFFKKAPNLINAEKLILISITLENNCYETMFKNCTLLESAPELPATDLSDACYLQMFENCKNLMVAPQLMATTWGKGNYAYESMFKGCEKLNYINVNMKKWNRDNTYYWVQGVAPTGRFVKPAELTNIPLNDENGIPSGWEVIDK